MMPMISLAVEPATAFLFEPGLIVAQAGKWLPVWLTPIWLISIGLILGAIVTAVVFAVLAFLSFVPAMRDVAGFPRVAA